MKRLEHFIESIILASRWLLVVFYLGLALALALYAIAFGKKLFEFSTKVFILEETDTILKMLGLIDAALVASLLVMVIISGYENFVSRFDNVEGELSWLGKIDAGSLKIKVASTIVAISSIHLLQVFLNASQFTDSKLMWLTIMHMAFVVSALFLAYIDRVMAQTKKCKDAD
ncbi:MAG: TIGR00645 family protein [Alphaproteobacteria bacterium]|nr:TIGR00645 family protein [Alphaproteobacteria bacterium]